MEPSPVKVEAPHTPTEEPVWCPEDPPVEEDLDAPPVEEDLDAPPALAEVAAAGAPNAASAGAGASLEAAAGHTTPPHQPSSGSALSVDAPAFVPRTPHAVSVFNPLDYSTATLRCDLAALTVGELSAFAARQFPAVFACGPCGLLLNGQPLPADAAEKALDAGVGNGGVVVLRPAPPVPDTVVQELQIGMAPLPPPQLQAYPQSPQKPQAQFMLQTSPQKLQQLPACASNGRAPDPQQLQNVQLQLAAMGAYNDSSSPPPATPPPLAPAASALPAALPPVWRAPRSPPSPVGAATTAAAAAALDAVAADLHAYALSGDGSRHAVQVLRTAVAARADEAVSRMVANVASQLPLLATHQHGSGLVSALAAAATPAQCATLVARACPHVARLTASNTGSDVVVALVNAAPAGVRDAATGRALIVDALLPAMRTVCTTVGGRKVLHAVVARLAAADVVPLYDSVAAQLTDIATDQCGCVTIQRLCDAAPDPALRNRLHSELMQAAEHLLTDPYGNYALQHAVKDSPPCAQVIAQLVAPRIVDLATNKFASNVIERCLQAGPDDVRALLIPLVSQPAALDVLMHDAFGNYVVQSCIDHAPPHLLDLLRENVAPRVAHSPYGYRIDTKLQHRARQFGRPGAGGRRGGPAARGRRGAPRAGGGAPAQYAPPPGIASPQLHQLPNGLTGSPVRRVVIVQQRPLEPPQAP